jgi:hypothetical protein
MCFDLKPEKLAEKRDRNLQNIVKCYDLCEGLDRARTTLLECGQKPQLQPIIVSLVDKRNRQPNSNLPQCAFTRTVLSLSMVKVVLCWLLLSVPMAALAVGNETTPYFGLTCVMVSPSVSSRQTEVGLQSSCTPTDSSQAMCERDLCVMNRRCTTPLGHAKVRHQTAWTLCGWMSGLAFQVLLQRHRTLIILHGYNSILSL